MADTVSQFGPLTDYGSPSMIVLDVSSSMIYPCRDGGASPKSIMNITSAAITSVVERFMAKTLEGNKL